MKIIKRILIVIMTLVIIGSLSYSVVLANSMYEKYTETIKWKNSSLLSKIHQVPPSLAQNYISTEEQRMLQILTDVNIALEEIKSAGEVSDKKYNDYWDLHEEAQAEIEGSEIYETLSAKDIFTDYDLHLNADLAIKKAYTDLNTEKLDGYAKEFASRLSKEDSEIEQSFLKQLRKISSDYKVLNEFSKNALSRIGVIENNVLKVDMKVNKQMTDDLVKEIYDKELTKFPHIKDLVDTLNGETWGKILAHNTSSMKYYSWKESQKVLDGLLRSSYISVASFSDVQDVLDYNPSISLEERENHTIDRDSVVTGVYYNGEKLNENLYVKRGTSLNFTIDYEYTELPKSTITIEYVDIDGNELSGREAYIGYVGSAINVNRKDITGYVFLRIENGLSEFLEEDSIITVVYEEEIIEEEIEEPEEEEIEEEPEEPIEEEEPTEPEEPEDPEDEDDEETIEENDE